MSKKHYSIVCGENFDGVSPRLGFRTAFETEAAAMLDSDEHEDTAVISEVTDEGIGPFVVLSESGAKKKRYPFTLSLNEVKQEDRFLMASELALDGHPNVSDKDLEQRYQLRPVTSTKQIAAMRRVFEKDEAEHHDRFGATESRIDAKVDGSPSRGYNYASSIHLDSKPKVSADERVRVEASTCIALYSDEGSPIGFVSGSRSISPTSYLVDGFFEVNYYINVHFAYIRPSFRGKGLGVFLAEYFGRLCFSDINKVVRQAYKLPIKITPVMHAEYVSFQGESFCETFAGEIDYCNDLLGDIEEFDGCFHNDFNVNRVEHDAGF